MFRRPGARRERPGKMLLNRAGVLNDLAPNASRMASLLMEVMYVSILLYWCFT